MVASVGQQHHLVGKWLMADHYIEASSVSFRLLLFDGLKMKLNICHTPLLAKFLQPHFDEAATPLL